MLCLIWESERKIQKYILLSELCPPKTAQKSKRTYILAFLG